MCVCEDEWTHLNESDDGYQLRHVLRLLFFSLLLLRELKGVVTSLSSDGHLLCSYMGTDPSFFSTPKVDAREADYEQVEAEMKKLQRLIREATRTQGGVPGRSVSQCSCSSVLERSALIPDILPKSSTEEDLAVSVAVSASMDEPSVNTCFHLSPPGSC